MIKIKNECVCALVYVFHDGVVQIVIDRGGAYRRRHAHLRGHLQDHYLFRERVTKIKFSQISFEFLEFKKIMILVRPKFEKKNVLPPAGAMPMVSLPRVLPV